MAKIRKKAAQDTVAADPSIIQKRLSVRGAESVQETPEADADEEDLEPVALVPAAAWEWSAQKRKAVGLVLKGWPDVRIAEKIGVHRHTIRHWRQTAEFRAEVMTQAREYMQRQRFKRVHETGVLCDQLAQEVAKRLSDMNRRGKEGPAAMSQPEVNAMQTFLREYREFRQQERQDFGDDIKRVEGSFVVQTAGVAEREAGAHGAQSFKAFVQQNMDKIPERVITEARTPQEALVNATIEVLKRTDALDLMHDEELTRERQSDAD